MTSPSLAPAPTTFRAGPIRLAAVAISLFVAGVVLIDAQSFNSGSDGSDGAFAPASGSGTIVFDPAQFQGSQVSANIFNFTTITIPAGVTVKLSGDLIKGPVVWLAQGNVRITGTIDLSGESGHAYSTNPFIRRQSAPGPGGFAGQIGGNQTQPALAGNGPSGGAAGNCSSGVYGRGGGFNGNAFLIPLVGGSGGGGSMSCGSDFYPGGGGGGGALLIASSTSVAVDNHNNSNGIYATGGFAGGGSGTTAGGGAGGAIRLVAASITVTGVVNASGGCGADANRHGTGGRVRFEAFSISGGPSTAYGCNGPAFTTSGPFPLLLTTTEPPSARVISIGGVTINPNPAIFPDITINTTAPVPVVIQTRNVPQSATVRLTILNQNGQAETPIDVPRSDNCDLSTNTCLTTVNVVFPFGASRGLTKVTWTP